jgi:hypothetical protein
VHHSHSLSNLPVAVIIRSAVAVAGLIAVAPIEVGQYEWPFRFIKHVFRRIRDSGSIDDDIFLLVRTHIDSILTNATRFGLGAVGAAVYGTTGRTSGTGVAVVVGRIGAITGPGFVVANRLKRGTLYIIQLQSQMREFIEYYGIDVK